MRRCAALVMLVGALTVSACGEPELQTLLAPPELAPLEHLSTITRPEDFAVASATSASGCEIFLMGVRGRYHGMVHMDGTTTIHEPWPTFNRRPGVEIFEGDRYVVWSAEPAFLGVFDPTIDEPDTRSPPSHPWGVEQVGPLTSLNRELIAMAAIGAEPPRRQPDPWKEAPLVTVFGRRDARTIGLGELTYHPGMFLTWRQSRAVVGRSAPDTVLSLALATGTLTTYAINIAQRAGAAVRESVLPHYFSAPVPREEVWIPDWIQVGGEIQLFLDVPHVEAATFDSEGRLYAVRNYDAIWTPAPNQFTRTQGSWIVTSRGLEVYGVDGALLGAFRLPGRDPAWTSSGWIRVGAHGRVFVPDGSGGVSVLKNPLGEPNTCPPLEPEISIE